jgi:hypothetical protein
MDKRVAAEDIGHVQDVVPDEGVLKLAEVAPGPKQVVFDLGPAFPAA